MGKSLSVLVEGLQLKGILISLRYFSDVMVSSVWEGEGTARQYFKRDMSLRGPSLSSYPLLMG